MQAVVYVLSNDSNNDVATGFTVKMHQKIALGTENKIGRKVAVEFRAAFHSVPEHPEKTEGYITDLHCQARFH